MALGLGDALMALVSLRSNLEVLTLNCSNRSAVYHLASMNFEKRVVHRILGCGVSRNLNRLRVSMG